MNDIKKPFFKKNGLYKYTQLQKRCHRKMKKGKSQIAISQANEPNEFICSNRTWTPYLPVAICNCFEAEK